MNNSFNLEQFILHHVTNSQEWHIPFLPVIPLPYPLSLHGLMLIICSVFLIITFCLLYDKKRKVPTGLTNLLELFIIFIRDEISIKGLGREDGRKLTPLFCTFFFFILGLNLMGLVPIFATATSNINVTGGLALITLTFMITGSIYNNGLNGFLKALMPSGVPIPVLFILFPIELVGLFIKSFALMIRLFANLLAGHIVILSLLGMVVLLGYVALPAIVLVVFINVLEIFIAFLQAYIFTLLSAIFIGQLYHPQH